MATPITLFDRLHGMLREVYRGMYELTARPLYGIRIEVAPDVFPTLASGAAARFPGITIESGEFTVFVHGLAVTIVSLGGGVN